MAAKSSPQQSDRLQQANSDNLIEFDDETPQRPSTSQGHRNQQPNSDTDVMDGIVSLPDTEDLPPSYQQIATNSVQGVFRAAEYVKDGKIHVLLAASGTLATEVLPNVIEKLAYQPDIAIRVVLDALAVKQLPFETLRGLPNVEAVYTDQDWPLHEPQQANASLQYELRSWLDYMLIVPCDATTVAKMTSWQADDLLTSILRVFDCGGKLNPPGRRGRFKYLGIAPAMDSVTWAHPAMKQHIQTLRNGWIWWRDVNQKKTSMEWAAVLRPDDVDNKVFHIYYNNCHTSLDKVVGEIYWQLAKYRPGSKWYAPGS